MLNLEILFQFQGVIYFSFQALNQLDILTHVTKYKRKLILNFKVFTTKKKTHILKSIYIDIAHLIYKLIGL